MRMLKDHAGDDGPPPTSTHAAGPGGSSTAVVAYGGATGSQAVPRQTMFNSIAEIIAWSIATVFTSEPIVLGVCRIVGISTDKDYLRSRAPRKPVKALKVDETDNIAKCRVSHVGYIWFGWKALAPVPHRRCVG